MTNSIPLAKVNKLILAGLKSVRDRKQSQVKKDEQFNQITLISYHIPKTAGTSFKASLEKGLGKVAVQYAYKDSYFKELCQGEPVWCWPCSKVLHGHFTYHKNQESFYPNAKKIVWLREPAERAWSLMNHWLRVKSGITFEMICNLQRLKPELKYDLNALFEAVIAESKFYNQFAAYQFYLKDLEKSDFFFIGNSDDFDNELERLAKLLSVELPALTLNKGKGTSSISEKNRAKFKKLYSKEYELYELLVA